MVEPAGEETVEAFFGFAAGEDESDGAASVFVGVAGGAATAFPMSAVINKIVV